MFASKMYKILLSEKQSARESRESFKQVSERDNAPLKEESLAAGTSEQNHRSDPRVEHWEGSNSSPSSHKPGLN